MKTADGKWLNHIEVPAGPGKRLTLFPKTEDSPGSPLHVVMGERFIERIPLVLVEVSTRAGVLERLTFGCMCQHTHPENVRDGKVCNRTYTANFKYTGKHPLFMPNKGEE